MLVAISSAIYGILTDFTFLQKWIFYNEIYFSRIVNELIEITRIIAVKRWISGGISKDG